jgi:hypothetical protein
VNEEEERGGPVAPRATPGFSSHSHLKYGGTDGTGEQLGLGVPLAGRDAADRATVVTATIPDNGTIARRRGSSSAGNSRRAVLGAAVRRRAQQPATRLRQAAEEVSVSWLGPVADPELVALRGAWARWVEADGEADDQLREALE